MKISLSWVREYTDVKSLTDELVKKIGAQLGGIDEVIELGARYDGIVVVRVVDCVKHLNADKLHVCKVDDGKVTKSVARDGKGLIQVVCGANNVKVGMLAAWIPPGVAVPSTIDKDVFTLEARDIRGQMSNGMLASLHELGISDDHEGILELNEFEVVRNQLSVISKKLTPGTPFKKLFGLDDIIIDIENKMFTHRPDCFGILGVAREIAGIQGHKFQSPDWYKKPITPQKPHFQGGTLEMGGGLVVRVGDKKLVPRFMAVAIADVKVGPSPVWMQAYLSREGTRPINNIVDITNYYMHLTGQPLHAYDADKLQSVSKKQNAICLETRISKKGEKLKLLGGKEITFEDDSTILITSSDVPVGIGGVMGGADTEVDENTKNIVLECANFDMYSIRRTAMKYGLFTEAVTRFNKGQSPLQTDRIIAKAAQEILQIAGGHLSSKTVDIKGSLSNTPHKAVTVSADFVNARLGTKLTLKDIAKLLENVEFKIMSVPADRTRLHVVPPFWRTDIEIAEDVVEEVGRLYGYDHLPLVLPKRDLTPVKPNEQVVFRANLRNVLAAAGANELLTYSFIHGNLIKNTGQDAKNAYELGNALSPDLQYYRMSMIPSLLEKVHPNIKAGQTEFAVYEMGKVHNKDQIGKDGLPIEEHRLGLIFAADDKSAKSYAGAPYYQAKKYLELILDGLGIKPVYEPVTHEPKTAIGKQALAPFEKTRAAYIKTTEGELIGEIGEFKASVRRILKLPAYCAGLELDIERLQKFAKSKQCTPLSRFPKVEQDISLAVPKSTKYQELQEKLDEYLQVNKPSNSVADVKPLDIYQSDNKKHVTFRVGVVSYERTLTAETVNKLLDDAAASIGFDRI